MPKICENFELDKVTDIYGTNRQLIVFCRDREAKDERWVVNCLSDDEARAIYNYLEQYFK